MPSTRISSVTFEHRTTGFGVGHATPRISWQFAATDGESKNWTQESYEIQVNRQGSAEAKTFKTQGSESVLVPWPDQPLQSRETAQLKIRAHGKVTNAAGQTIAEATDWSDAATVELSLLDKKDWTAKLMASKSKADISKTMRPILFRKGFSLPADSGKISRARLYITAHGVYEAFINGLRVGDEEMAPGWTSYNHRLLYSTFDVTAALATDGPNIIAAEVAEGWFSGRLGMDNKRCFYGERIALLAQLEVTFDNGHVYTLVSDDTWQSHLSAVTRSEIYDGEDHDFREEQSGWNKDANFDESAWLPTEELPFPTSRLEASDTPPVRKKEEIQPINIFKSKSGKTLVDFGQNIVGKLQVRLPAVTSATNLEGHTLAFSHAEVLERDELGTRPLRGATPIDHVVLSARQSETWSPKFTFHGFRYVQIDGWPTETGLPGQDDLRALVLHSDMKRTGWFSCSDPLVNKLHENVCWSIKGNFFSVPTDCPQRDERLGWTGDIQVFSPSAHFIYNAKGFLGSWLDDVASEQLEERRKGVPGLVVPDVFDIPAFPPGPQSVWHDVTVLTPWDLYVSSGDAGILRTQYASMKAWVDQGLPRGKNGLWDQNVWQFGDWLDPAAPPSEPGNGRTDSLLVADAYLVRVLETISKVAAVIGETTDAENYARDASSVKKTFQDEYITPSGLLVGDTQTAQSLAISFGLFSKKEHFAKAASRLCHLVHLAKYRISTGFVGTPLITHALSDMGHHQLAYRMLLEKECPSWLYPITMGATTVWERWDSMLPDGSINAGEMTSFNHYALGSVAHWLHKNVGGISPVEPGWRSIKVRPVPGGTVTSANVAHEGPYGRISCSWNINNDRFELVVVVPPNSTATVILPSEWKVGQDEEEKGTQIGSGKYQFSCEYKPTEWPPAPEFARSTFRLEV